MTKKGRKAKDGKNNREKKEEDKLIFERRRSIYSKRTRRKRTRQRRTRRESKRRKKIRMKRTD
jgi:hypothetical protein